MNSRPPTSNEYDGIYRRKRFTTILDEIAAEVVGDSEITKLNCTGFLGRGDRDYYRDFLGQWISQTRPATLLDLGCGTGLFGAWIAEQLGLDLVGIDFSPVAISLANGLTSHSHGPRKTFRIAPFDSTHLREHSVSATFSLDALYLATNPVAALWEAQRVMKPQAPLLFTYFVDSENQHDWPGFVRNAGLNILFITDVTTAWREHMHEKHLRRWKCRRAIREKLGARAEPELSVTSSMLGLNGRSSYITSTFRYLLHAIS